jgi:hypothetical protein
LKFCYRGRTRVRGGPTRVPTRVARPYPGRHFTDVATSPVSSRESACESRPPEKHSVRQRDAGSRSGSPQWSRDTSCFQYPAERACGAWPASSSPPSDLSQSHALSASVGDAGACRPACSAGAVLAQAGRQREQRRAEGGFGSRRGAAACESTGYGGHAVGQPDRHLFRGSHHR